MDLKCFLSLEQPKPPPPCGTFLRAESGQHRSSVAQFASAASCEDPHVGAVQEHIEGQAFQPGWLALVLTALPLS